MNYQLDWQVNLADHLVAVAPYGGPVGENLFFFLDYYNMCMYLIAVIFSR